MIFGLIHQTANWYYGSCHEKDYINKKHGACEKQNVIGKRKNILHQNLALDILSKCICNEMKANLQSMNSINEKCKKEQLAMNEITEKMKEKVIHC